MKRGAFLLFFVFVGLISLRAVPTEAAQKRKQVPAPQEEPVRRTGLHRPLGLGLLIGEPTGPTFKLWLPENRALDGGIAFSLRSFFLVYVDYLFHFPQGLGTSGEFISQLEPYVGAGAVIFISTQTGRTDSALFTQSGDTKAFGLRIPLGVEWMIPKAPVGLYVELVPGVGFIPSTFAFFQGGVGARFYF